jgi:tetratricopeptide (TPR) repeat protein
MKLTRRLMWLSGLLLAGAAVLGYRYWTAHTREAILLAARAQLERKNPAGAITALRPLLERGRQDEELLTLAARSYRLAGYPERSLQLLAATGERDDTSAESDLERALALFELGRFTEAEPLLRASPTKDALAALSEIYLQRFEMDRALGALESWVRLDPADPAPHLLIGDVWIEAPDHEKAIQSFRRALELQPNLPIARERLASVQLELGQLDEAGELLRQCHEEMPSRADIALKLARCEMESGRVSEARTLLRQLVTEHPAFAAALIELGKLELDEGDCEPAAALLTRAVAADPSQDAAWYNLAVALERLGRTDEAAESLAKWTNRQRDRQQLREQLDLIQSDPADIDAHVRAGEISLTIGDAAQAQRHFIAALRQNPDHTAAREGMSRLNELFADRATDPHAAHAAHSDGIRP